VSVVHVSALGGARDVARAGADGLAHVFSDSIIDAALAAEIARRKLFVIPTLSIHHAFEAAAAFRFADRGRIAPEARADLLLVPGNPLIDIRASRAIARIFKNGFEVSRTPPAMPAQQ
jgi:hypothetical protein